MGYTSWNAVRHGLFEAVRVLATDGSEASRAAVDATIAIAKSLTAKVRVAQVWNLEVRHRHEQRDGDVRGEAGKLVDATVERLFQAGVIAEREICRADSTHVAAAIACAARAFGADLVVIGSQGLSDWRSLTLRSETNQMLCGLDCPLLIVRAATSGPSIRKWNVVFAIAAGDDLEPGVRAAVAVGRSNASVVVVHVAQTIAGLHRFAYLESGDEIRETMARACKLLGDAGVKADGVVAHAGPVTNAVAEIATDSNADLIVIGSSRMGDIGSLFLGSLSQDLLQVTDRPVLVPERVQA
jgi:nucleotide-binding universal stress UspA family protein